MGVALHPPARLPRAQGQDADDAVRRAPVARQGAQEQVGALRRAGQQHVLRVGRGIGGVPRGLQQARHPPAGQHQAECRGVDQREGVIGRPPGTQQMQPDGEGQRRDQRRAGHGQQVARADEAPVLLRQPERRARQDQRRHRPRQGPHPPGSRRPDARRRRPDCGRQRDQRQQAVEGKIQQDAKRGAAGHVAAIRRPRRDGQPSDALPAGEDAASLSL
jgi:hypothetical protein